MQTSRLKLFLENFLVYGLGGIISRIVPLIMLPVITRLYPDAMYIGLSDLSMTFIQFAAALAVCGTYDAMFRLFFDKNDTEAQREVCSTTMIFVSVNTAVMAVIFYLLKGKIALWYFGDERYIPLVVITIVGFLLNSTNQIISAPTRIQNKRKVFLVTNTLSPVLSYLVAIPLILSGHYVIAMPLAMMISGAVLEASFGVMNRKFFSFSCFKADKLKELIKIGLPLMPNFLIYWLYNSADKIMIAQILGSTATGVYSISSKIGHISNLIYTAFSGGWLFFAYSTMNDDDQVQMKSNIFEYLGAISFASAALMTAFSKFGFALLFPSEYQEGYIAAPYLFLSPLLLMLYQVAANQFSIIKKTYMNLMALMLGAAANIILNLFLIPEMGIEGAAVATLMGYVISLTVCMALLIRMKLISLNKMAAVNILIFTVYFLLWRFRLHTGFVISICSGLAVAAVYFFIYRKEIIKAFGKILNR